MTEEIMNQEEKVYRERLLYAGELTKRIASVLNACENYQNAYEAMQNLRAFLLPVVKNEIASQSAGLRSAYNGFVRRLPQPVLTIPTLARRPNGYSGSPNLGNKVGRLDNCILRQQAASSFFMGKTSPTTLYWQDFPAAVREILQNYFVPGQCVNTSQVQQLAFYVYARAEVELIIKSADAHGLLLITGQSVAQGGMSLYDPGERVDDGL